MEREFNNILKVADAMGGAKPKALKSASVFVKGEAKVRCPVLSGNLKNSIDDEVLTNDAIIGTNVEYAPYVEFGTSKQGAQPYLRPAVDENASKIDKLITDVIKEEMEKAAR